MASGIDNDQVGTQGVPGDVDIGEAGYSFMRNL